VTKPSLRRRLVRIAIEVAIVVAIFGVAGALRSRDHLRGPVPALTLAALEGPAVALPALAGKPAILAFFAPWCGVCKITAQNVRWAADAAGERARVVSIGSSYEESGSVRAYAAEHELPAPVLLDEGGRAAAAFGVTAYPTFIFVDARGRVTGSTVGYTTTAGLLARLFL
jgi:peroxiredoxin